MNLTVPLLAERTDTTWYRHLEAKRETQCIDCVHIIGRRHLRLTRLRRSWRVAFLSSAFVPVGVLQRPCIDNFLPNEVLPCKENDRSSIYELDRDGRAYGNIYELRKVHAKRYCRIRKAKNRSRCSRLITSRSTLGYGLLFSTRTTHSFDAGLFTVVVAPHRCFNIYKDVLLHPSRFANVCVSLYPLLRAGDGLRPKSLTSTLSRPGYRTTRRWCTKTWLSGQGSGIGSGRLRQSELHPEQAKHVFIAEFSE